MFIKPTIGRVVWYWPGGSAHKDEGGQPCSAQIAFVLMDGRINIGYLDQRGFACSALAVPLVQDGDVAPSGHFCEWMPYQKGQAAKTEQAEQQLAAAVKSA